MAHDSGRTCAENKSSNRCFAVSFSDWIINLFLIVDCRSIMMYKNMTYYIHLREIIHPIQIVQIIWVPWHAMTCHENPSWSFSPTTTCIMHMYLVYMLTLSCKWQLSCANIHVTFMSLTFKNTFLHDHGSRSWTSWILVKTIDSADSGPL